jgi:hypothetical protein
MKYWLCIVFSVVLFSCDKSIAAKTGDNGNNQTESGAVTEIEDTAVVSEDTGNTVMEEGIIDNTTTIIMDFTPKYIGSLVPDDFISLGLTNFKKMSQLIARLPPEVIAYTYKIIIDFPGIEDFKGIEVFPKLQSLVLSSVEFSDLTDIAAAETLEWLYLTNSKLQSLSGISRMNKLYVLSIEGTILADIESVKGIPSRVKGLNLSRFKEYKEFLEYVPDTVEELYLQENGINSLSEIEYLQNRKNLETIYMWGNNLSREDVGDILEWGHIHLIFYTEL